MEFAEAGARLVKPHPSLGTGLHLNLTEGMPLTDAKSLRGKDGQFRDLKGQLIALTTGRVVAREIEVEVNAQWDRMRSMDLPVAHINGHQHIHLFGDVLPITLDMARRLKTPVRRPVEPLWGNLGGSIAYFIRRLLLRWGVARGTWDGIESPDHFIELTGPRHGRSAQWLTNEILSREGLIEVLCHPGEFDPDTTEPLRDRRVEELTILTTAGLRDRWTSAGIHPGNQHPGNQHPGNQHPGTKTTSV